MWGYVRVNKKQMNKPAFGKRGDNIRLGNSLGKKIQSVAWCAVRCIFHNCRLGGSERSRDSRAGRGAGWNTDSSPPPRLPTTCSTRVRSTSYGATFSSSTLLASPFFSATGARGGRSQGCQRAKETTPPRKLSHDRLAGAGDVESFPGPPWQESLCVLTLPCLHQLAMYLAHAQKKAIFSHKLSTVALW